jgi:hypothetical protein
MRNLEKIASREIEEALIADAENVGAWDEPIKMAASKSPRPDWYGKNDSRRADCGKEVEAQETNVVVRSVIE